MKRITLANLVLLMAATALVGCSSKKTETAPSATSTSSSKVVASSKASKTIEPSGVTYLTDEEIDAAQTVGDSLEMLSSLLDSLKIDMDHLIEQLPEEYKAQLALQQMSLYAGLESAYATIDGKVKELGADTPIPEESRAEFLGNLKTLRDDAKNGIDTLRQEIETLLNESN